jgi:hypothetical protein
MIFEYFLNGFIQEYEIQSAKINEITTLKCIVLRFVPYEPNSSWIMVIEDKFQYKKYERLIIKNSQICQN